MLLVNANAALLAGDAEVAIDAITSLAELVFAFYPVYAKSHARQLAGIAALLASWRITGRSCLRTGIGNAQFR